MKLIELHILQSFPVSCLNRDDLGAPKTAIFGGANRSRISSQCLKRAIRASAKTMLPARFAGDRSRLFIKQLTEALKKHGIAESKAFEVARDVLNALLKKTNDEEKKTEGKEGESELKTLLFLSPYEIDAVAEMLASKINLGVKDFKDVIKKGVIKNAINPVALKDAADIAIFGRMVANDHSLTLEGAGMFSHALSTHQVRNDIDFFSAVDDLQAEGSGAGMIETLEFTSATYYRYAALNLDLLADADHLGSLTPMERKEIVETFLRAAIIAVPGARKNSMNAHTLPGYVLGVVKSNGQPLQLVNAFEKPIKPEPGLLDVSIKALIDHHEQLKKTWGIEMISEQVIPNIDLNTFCKELVTYVI